MGSKLMVERRSRRSERAEEKEGRWWKRMEGEKANKNVQDKVRMEGGKEGGAELTSIWFNILLYSVLRASRVTRTRPS